MTKDGTELEKDEGFEKTVRYTEEQLAEFDRIYDEEFTPAWENEGQYCRAGGGQYEKSFAWWAWKKRQEKIDELRCEVKRINLWYSNVKLQLENKEIDSAIDAKKINELQKRVDELESQLKDWKQKSMPAMLNGMCDHCGKEPLQGIVSDKEDYALLHCFGCGANKYEWIGEQALKGGISNE